MDCRRVRHTARLVLFMLLFALAYLASVPFNDASATSGGDAHDGLAPKIPQSQTDIAGPPGSGRFGVTVTVLPNGNFVVWDPDFSEGGLTSIGAVYLYSGATRTIISTLKGSTAWDHVGSPGVIVLTNGNFVVLSSSWDNPVESKVDVGAATWCSATTGCNGVITAANSLIGDTAYDHIGWGSSGGQQGVTALTNGNYVVRSPEWDNPDGALVNVGAVTWCNGTSGCNGVVSAANSLIGGTTFDSVGIWTVTALTNGNYVVSSLAWDNPDGSIKDAGAVTWGNGATGTIGLVTTANSLVGGSTNDQIGEMAVTALTNGNYVVNSPSWDNPVAMKADVGAVTWGNGATGTIGLVTGANSLIGNTASDQVGRSDQFGMVGTLPLTNGNYVVPARYWDNPNGPKVNAGSVTWCSGSGGCVGVISAATSLVGGTLEDNVGIAVMPLKNGNYVVATPSWDNPDGAKVNVGAVTWCSGASGCIGLVTAANSLTGDTANDQVGGVGVAALTNGSYVVRSPLWNNPDGSKVDVGAATWCSGTTGCQGAPTAANSLIGGTAGDQVGYAVVALTNGNYVVFSPYWDNPGLISDVGAVTWCSGASGCSGLVTAANSLTGGTLNDFVGLITTALPNGSYVVKSRFWDNPSGLVANAGAMSWGSGTGGTTGLITSAHSVLGTVTDGIDDFSYDTTRNRLFVGRSESNLVSILYFASADLQNLALSSGTLAPAFATATTSYTAQVGSSVASLTVTPTAVDPTASITVNGAAVASGSASGAINLHCGANVITVVVTAAQDGTTTRTYSVSVTRANPLLWLPLLLR